MKVVTITRTAESRINSLLTEKKLPKLLALEKKKRGVPNDKLVFVGMANIAEYFWCAMHSVLKSREDESSFFGAYLQDRLKYALRLGLIKKLPDNDNDLLSVGDSITLADIEASHKQDKKKNVDGAISMVSVEIIDKEGRRIMVLNSNLPPEEKIFYEKLAKKKGVKIGNLEKYPTVRGDFMHFDNKENYGSVRWNFQWDSYVIVGIPDGLTDKFVYEYKTTRSKFLSFFMKPCAFAQADLYGYFFKRRKKRVQIYIMENSQLQTWEELINEERTVELLNNFKQVDEGKLFPPSPKKWKCEKCVICQFGKLCSTKI